MEQALVNFNQFGDVIRRIGALERFVVTGKIEGTTGKSPLECNNYRRIALVSHAVKYLSGS